MKALIRKYPINCSKQFQNEVYLYSQWADWIDDNGNPLTNEEYHYALCENAPDNPIYEGEGFLKKDIRLNVANYDVEEHEIEENGKSIRYWTAVCRLNE